MSATSWVTLATNDSYSLGALVLGHSLRNVSTTHQLTVLVTPGVTKPMRDRLSSVFNNVKEVNILDSQDKANLALLARPDLGITFTKLHCWRLTEFSKAVFLDADTLVLKNCDELFDREEFSAAPDSGWPDCFNSGVFVYKPSEETYQSLLQFAVTHGSFDGGDQGLLNLYFADWATKDISRHLPFIYNMVSSAFYSYIPALKQFGDRVKIVHFIGSCKPWLQYFDSETMKTRAPPGSEHLQPLLQLWWDIFCSRVHAGLTVDMVGLAGAFAQLTLGVPRTADQIALDEHLRRQTWEEGKFDYMGVDAFDNIWQKITETLAEKSESKADEIQQVVQMVPSDQHVSSVPPGPLAQVTTAIPEAAISSVPPASAQVVSNIGISAGSPDIILAPTTQVSPSSKPAILTETQPPKAVPAAASIPHPKSESLETVAQEPASLPEQSVPAVTSNTQVPADETEKVSTATTVPFTQTPVAPFTETPSQVASSQVDLTFTEQPKQSPTLPPAPIQVPVTATVVSDSLPPPFMVDTQKALPPITPTTVESAPAPPVTVQSQVVPSIPPLTSPTTAIPPLTSPTTAIPPAAILGVSLPGKLPPSSPPVSATAPVSPPLVTSAPQDPLLTTQIAAEALPSVVPATVVPETSEKTSVPVVLPIETASVVSPPATPATIPLLPVIPAPEMKSASLPAAPLKETTNLAPTAATFATALTVTGTPPLETEKSSTPIVSPTVTATVTPATPVTPPTVSSCPIPETKSELPTQLPPTPAPPSPAATIDSVLPPPATPISDAHIPVTLTSATAPLTTPSTTLPISMTTATISEKAGDLPSPVPLPSSPTDALTRPMSTALVSVPKAKTKVSAKVPEPPKPPIPMPAPESPSAVLPPATGIAASAPSDQQAPKVDITTHSKVAKPEDLTGPATKKTGKQPETTKYGKDADNVEKFPETQSTETESKSAKRVKETEQGTDSQAAPEKITTKTSTKQIKQNKHKAPEAPTKPETAPIKPSDLPSPSKPASIPVTQSALPEAEAAPPVTKVKTKIVKAQKATKETTLKDVKQPEPVLKMVSPLSSPTAGSPPLSPDVAKVASSLPEASAQKSTVVPEKETVASSPASEQASAAPVPPKRKSTKAAASGEGASKPQSKPTKTASKPKK